MIKKGEKRRGKEKGKGEERKNSEKIGEGRKREGGV